MVILEFISLANIISFIFLAVLPMLLLCFSLFKPRGMYYVTLGLGVFSLIALFTGYYKAIGAYLLVYILFAIFWAVKGGREYEECGYKFNIYRNLYASYYADDLNDDGIIDAFDNWKIAHDPKYSWIFASRKVRNQRKLKGYYNFGYRTDTRAANQNRNRWNDDWDSSSQSRSNTYSSSQSRSNTYSSSQSRSNTYSSSQSRSNTYSSSQSRSNTYSSSQSQSNREASMSEEERRVARQHEFARQHNLRYFAMCTSKDEGKKLYHKYAAKFHPDNAITGNKEKFIAVDEEYNRFCKINDADFVA